MERGAATQTASDTNETEPARCDAVVVGAGFSGLYLVHRLREEGYSVVGIEAGDDVGGTWYWNRYPGARCDIPSLLYSYTWSQPLRDEWEWSEKYATQPEILAYIEKAAELHDLRSAYRFETRVVGAHLEEGTGRWTVTTDGGERFDARFVFMATGCLSRPKEPDLPGIDAFAGESYVTGRWPHDGVDFAGKRVGVIGTGSSAIQSIPLIAKDAASVTVFQRTPNFSLPALNAPLSSEEREGFAAQFDDYKAAIDAGEIGFETLPDDWDPSDDELREHVEILWNGGGLVSTTQIPRLTRDERINRAASDFVRGRIAAIVDDPDLADRLTPRDFPLATKRACVDTDYYKTFNQDHVTLVDLRDTPIETITEAGVRTTEREYPFDVIVYALGFDAITGALDAIDIAGRDARRLRDRWRDGAHSLYGIAVEGFPNLFLINGPNSPSVLANVITAAEHHIDYLMGALAQARKDGADVIEADGEAQREWVEHCSTEAEATLFPKANSWYIGANVEGKPRAFLPYVGMDFKKRLNASATDGYPELRMEARKAGARSDAVYG